MKNSTEEKVNLHRHSLSPSEHQDKAEQYESLEMWAKAAEHYRLAAGSYIGDSRIARMEASAEKCDRMLS